jgi:hypothetical protein
VAFVIAALCAIVLGCTTDGEPDLPSSADISAIVERVTGPGGQEFLRDITTAKWSDDGRRAAELFTWIAQDAHSSDPSTATRAGQTAHSIASFLADARDVTADAPTNPPLWKAFAQSLVPYLGAAVGDPTGVAGFTPLDGLDSQMRKSAEMFATLTKDTEANQIFTEAASDVAHAYEVAFAKAAVAQPMKADRGDAQRELLRAARLRGLVAAGAYIADPQGGKPIALRAMTEVAYQVASLTVRPGDPHISPEFFDGERLLPPGEISNSDWSIYDAQLSVYLSSSPRINEAIRQFGRTYGLIASGQ